MKAGQAGETKIVISALPVFSFLPVLWRGAVERHIMSPFEALIFRVNLGKIFLVYVLCWGLLASPA